MRDLSSSSSSSFLGSRRRSFGGSTTIVTSPKKETSRKSSNHRTKRMFVVPLLARKEKKDRTEEEKEDSLTVIREDPALWLNADLMLDVFSFLVGEEGHVHASYDRQISILEVGRLYLQLALVSKTWKQVLDDEIHELITIDGRGRGGMILDFNKCCRPNIDFSMIAEGVVASLNDAVTAAVGGGGDGDGGGDGVRRPTLLNRIQLLVAGTGTGTTTIPDSSSTFPLIVRWMVKTGVHIPTTTLRLPNSSVGLMPKVTTNASEDTSTTTTTSQFLTSEYQKYQYGVGILLKTCNTQHLLTFSDGRMESNGSTTTALRRSDSSSSSSDNIHHDDELEFQDLIAKECPNLQNLSITLFYNASSATTATASASEQQQQLLISPALFSLESLQNLFVKPIFPSTVGVNRPNPNLFTNLISNLPSLTRLTIDGTCIPDYVITTNTAEQQAAGRGVENNINNINNPTTYIHFDIASSSLQYIHGYGFLDRPNVQQCTNLVECTGFVPTVTQRLDDLVRQVLL